MSKQCREWQKDASAKTQATGKNVVQQVFPRQEARRTIGAKTPEFTIGKGSSCGNPYDP